MVAFVCVMMVWMRDQMADEIVPIFLGREHQERVMTLSVGHIDEYL
jgi:hypothetical protein